MSPRPPTSPVWRLYERLVAEAQSEKASDSITVIPNARIKGAITGIDRQIDVLIDARPAENIERRVIVDAKCHRRKIDVGEVEAFEGMMRDCRAQRGILVCSSGYTESALRRAQASITISLLDETKLEEFDANSWDPCLGTCATQARGRMAGWVLYDQPFGLAVGTSPLSIVCVGKCDGCGDFHIWCWDCGKHFALEGEAEAGCGCERLWLTAREEEGVDDHGNTLESILLILASSEVPAPLIVDRRPLN